MEHLRTILAAFLGLALLTAGTVLGMEGSPGPSCCSLAASGLVSLALLGGRRQGGQAPDTDPRPYPRIRKDA